MKTKKASCLLTAFAFLFFLLKKEFNESSDDYESSDVQRRITNENWHFKAAHGQDIWLLQVLGWPREERMLHNMTFIEAGTFDGITGSNMYAMEKTLNWKGVCFEPNKDLFKLVLERRSCFKINAGLCDATGTFDFTQFKPPYDQESGILAFLSATKRKDINNKIASGVYHIANTYEIECVSVKDSLVRAFGRVIRIDVFSLDVESSEINVLRSIDFHSVIIDILFVECSHEVETINFMAKTNLYEHVSKVGDDLVFFRKTSKYIQTWKNGCKCFQEGNECFYKFVAPDMHWECSNYE